MKVSRSDFHPLSHHKTRRILPERSLSNSWKKTAWGLIILFTWVFMAFRVQAHATAVLPDKSLELAGAKYLKIHNNTNY